MKPLLIPEMSDSKVRENFQRIQDFYTKEYEALTMKKLAPVRFEHTASEAGVQKVAHGLGQIPTDLWITWVSAGTATLNYGNMTETMVEITTTAACTLRGFAGKYTG